MNIFEVIGLVLIGPSSPHTAGAVRIGKTARRLLGEPVQEALIRLHGSVFLLERDMELTRQSFSNGSRMRSGNSLICFKSCWQ